MKTSGLHLIRSKSLPKGHAGMLKAGLELLDKLKKTETQTLAHHSWRPAIQADQHAQDPLRRIPQKYGLIAAEHRTM